MTCLIELNFQPFISSCIYLQISTMHIYWVSWFVSSSHVDVFFFLTMVVYDMTLTKYLVFSASELRKINIHSIILKYWVDSEEIEQVWIIFQPESEFFFFWFINNKYPNSIAKCPDFGGTPKISIFQNLLHFFWYHAIH